MNGKRYSAPIEFVHAALARKFQRENPSGKTRRRRRFLTHSDQWKFGTEKPLRDFGE